MFPTQNLTQPHDLLGSATRGPMLCPQVELINSEVLSTERVVSWQAQQVMGKEESCLSEKLKVVVLEKNPAPKVGVR